MAFCNANDLQSLTVRRKEATMSTSRCFDTDSFGDARSKLTKVVDHSVKRSRRLPYCSLDHQLSHTAAKSLLAYVEMSFLHSKRAPMSSLRFGESKSDQRRKLERHRRRRISSSGVGRDSLSLPDRILKIRTEMTELDHRIEGLTDSRERR